MESKGFLDVVTDLWKAASFFKQIWGYSTPQDHVEV
jgi:hypothetical protein